MSNPSKKYICKICNKEFSARQNIWKHNVKFHEDKKNVMSVECLKPSENLEPISNKSLKLSEECPKMSESIKGYSCNKCNKKFNNRKTKWSHEKICKENICKENINDKLQELETIKQLFKEQTDAIKKEREQFQKEKEQFQKEKESIKTEIIDLLNKQFKVHPKTLQKINKTLQMQILNNSNNNNTVNSNNNTVNNNYIVQLGFEKLYEVFPKNKQIEVLQQKYGCLPYLIGETHLNHKYPQYKNIMITNLQNNIAYRYDRHINRQSRVLLLLIKPSY